MCDYSLHLVASRPAKVGEKLISTRYGSTTCSRSNGHRRYLGRPHEIA